MKGTDPKAKPAGDVRGQFKESGFEVAELQSDRQTLEVKKGNCTRVLKRNARGAWLPAGPPYFLVRGLKCELEDRGYQKFWYSDGRRFPVRQADLKTLHGFDEGVRAVLGLRSLYNESLGSTCARTVYDRLSGRPDR